MLQGTSVMMQEFGKHFKSIQNGILEREYDPRVKAECECKKGLALFRCEQCFQHSPSCADCLVASHHHNPFHHVQKWTGSYFVRTTLGALGHTLFLGHDSERCENSPP